MYRDYGISQNRPLWCDVHEDKKLGWKATQGIQNIGIEDSQGNRIVDQKQVLKILGNYVTELYDRPNRPESLKVEPEEEVDTDE